jgi:hypothetical protein
MRCAPPVHCAQQIPIFRARILLPRKFCRQRQNLPSHAAPNAEMHALSAANPDVPRTDRE